MPVPAASALPAELTSLPQWIAWRTETREGSSKPTKVPYCLATGYKASSTKSSDWAEYPDPVSVPAAYNGIGFVFTKAAGFTGVDLDDCLKPDGTLKAWAVEVLDALPSYAEISPSGTGIKIWTKAQIPGTGLKVWVDADGNRTVESMADGAIEIYDTGRYFAVTGNNYAGTLAINELQPAIAALYKRLRGNERPELPLVNGHAKSPSSFEIPAGAAIAEGGRHAFLISTAAKWRARGMDIPELLGKLRELNAARCSPPKPDNMLVGIAKWFEDKPPSYRPTRADYASAAQWAVAPTVEKVEKRGENEEKPAAPPTAQSADRTTEIPRQPAGQLSNAVKEIEVEQAPEPAGPEPSSPLAFRVGQAIARGVESCYEPDLARLFALAYLGGAQSTIEADAFEAKLKEKYKEDLNLQRLRRAIRAIRDEISGSIADSAESGGYIRTSEGVVKPLLSNAITAFSPLDLAFDTFQQRVVLRDESPWGTKGQWTDDDDLQGTEHLQRTGILIENLRTTNGAARRVALRKPFHPVRDWLDSLQWDSKPRLDFWLNTYMGVEETDLTIDFARMWMISAVARIYSPGCKADCMLVMESDQGVRKSSALRVLVNGHLDAGKEPFWFRDRIPTLSSDDVGLHMQGVWVIEIAELDAIRRSAAWTATKNFISDQSDTFRRKYGINLQDYPRQCVFAGSTNEKEWLGDHTGGRRFWAVKVANVDIDGIQRDREQLWAEAVHQYKAGAPWYLSDDQETAAAKEIESRMPEDVWHERVVNAVDALALTTSDDYDSIAIPQVLDVMKIPAERQGQSEQSRVARVLRSIGYGKFRSSADAKGRRQWRYRKLI